MKVAGLFAGIGGIELGLERAGFETALLCENDPGARVVLTKHFPAARQRADVRDIENLPKKVDLLTAGFPCQDLSQAGRTRGIRGKRSSLVREVFRLLEKTPVPWVLIENVPFLLRLGGGNGMHYIVRNLERLGYRWAYRVIDTRAFGLPQRRERVYLLASRVDDPGRVLFSRDHAFEEPTFDPEVAHGFYWTEGTKGLGWAVDAVPTIKGGSGIGIPSPPAIWFPSSDFGTPDIRDAEKLQGFNAGWTKAADTVAGRSRRWTLVGNAVSVPVAQWIGERLLSAPAKRKYHMRPLAPGASWPGAACGGPKDGRFVVEQGRFPVQRKREHLEQFLRFEPRPLSHRAASGFLERLQASRLNRQKAFEHALVRYVRDVAYET